MRVLLDTHAVIWWVDQDSLLSRPSHAAIADPANELLVSAATVWEIAIKLGIARLSLSMPYRQWMDQAIAGLQASLLPITVEYAERLAELPSHHRDPFDRLLIAQALVEEVPVVSADTTFEQYGVTPYLVTVAGTILLIGPRTGVETDEELGARARESLGQVPT